MTNMLNMFSLDESEKKNLLYIVLTGLVLRVFFIVETSGTPFVAHLFSDSKIYLDWAKSLANDGWIGNIPFFMAPVYPHILGVYVEIFGESLFFFRVVQALVSTLNILVIYLTGREYHSKTTGYIGAILSALYSVFIFYSGAILSETFQVFVLSLLLLMLVQKDKYSDTKHWLLTGILLGLAVLFRGNILLFLPVGLIWIFRLSEKLIAKNRRITAAIFFLVGTFIPILPVTGYNYAVSGDFVLLTTNGGINFYLGNNEDSPGVYINPKEFDISSDMAGKKFAQRQTGQKMTDSDASSYWYSRGIDYLTGEPGDAVLLYANKFFLFWGEGENPQSTIMDLGYFEKHYSNILTLPLPGFFLISLLSIIGIVFSFRDKNQNKLFILFVFTYIAATLLFFVNGRYRLGITPALIILASYSVYNIFDIIKNGEFSKLKLPGYVIGGFLFFYTFFSFQPVYGEFDAYIHLGDIEYEEENYEKAVEYYNRSLFFQDNALAYMNMGNALARLKDFRSAVSSYQKAINRDGDNLLAHFNLAFAYTQMGNFQEAIKEYNTCIELDPTFANAYRNLGITLYVQELYEEALPYFEKFLTLSTDPEVNSLVQKDIENIKLKLQLQKQD
ncbi:MAG: O-linked GlcNAc transferase [Melioribacteraceae bacterium]|nr:MAG: O-linked GlcNAc transferase [Melioribacteraceae bacterium]